MPIQRLWRALRSAGVLDRPAVHRRRPRLLLWSGALLAGLATATAGSSAKAAFAYAWESGSSFSFADGVSASPTGTLTVNPPNAIFSSDEIVLAGSGSEAGTYGPDYYDAGTLTYTDGLADLTLSFVGGLDSGPTQAQLDSVQWTQGDNETTASKVSGGLQLTESIAAVPEPSTWMLLGVGVAGIAIARGRRKNDTASLRAPRATSAAVAG